MLRVAKRALVVVCLGLAMVGGAGSCVGAADLSLLDLSSEQALTRLTPGQPDQVSVARAVGAPGLVVTCRPGANAYPGVVITPEAAFWNLSAFGHVEARVVNTGSLTSGVSLRVDNEGDWAASPWSSETLWLKPGEAGTIHVRFGYAWGKPGFALNTARINQMLLYVSKADKQQSFRLESLVAGGEPGEKPPVDPNQVRTRPEDGVILGKGSTVDASTQLVAQGGVQTALTATEGAQSLRITFPAGARNGSVLLKPGLGMWNLRDWLQVVVQVHNEGKEPLTVRARLENRGRPSEWVAAPTALAPGAQQELVLPFAGSMAVWADGLKSPTGGSRFDSDAASGISITATGEGEGVLRVSSVRAVVPPTPELPEWLGKRPPVPGEWTQTLAEDFDRATLDETRWSIYYPNYWDKRAHFSKDNVLLGEGLLRLRFEKKRGHAEDNPAKPETDWQTGFLTSVGKWRQRYGYFECRLKLPTAPGLWPAFWMMPDRGDEAGNQRERTSDGGMEFDVLEYLTRYGPYRYNIAWHWDGYGKDHKSIGTERIYVQPDREGFITAGLLWEPGRITFYANGTALAQWIDARVASVPEYILFTAVSGGWGGNELTGEGLPDDFVLDYVRVWQRSDWAVETPR